VRNFITRLERIEQQLDNELREVSSVEDTMKRLLSFRPEWKEQIERFGHPRDWPENIGLWEEATEDLQIVLDLFLEWLETAEEYEAVVFEPWEIGMTSDIRTAISMGYSYRGPDHDYSADLSSLIALRKDWASLKAKYGHPRNWPENKGRWAKGDIDAVILQHLATEWDREWHRRCEIIVRGIGWFLVRRVPLKRAPDKPSDWPASIARDRAYLDSLTPRGVA
jgi:hypothetical protein